MPAENHTVNATFNIITANSSGTPAHLFINAGMQGISFTEWDKESNTFSGVLVYHFSKQLSKNEIAAEIETILNHEETLQKTFAKVRVIWCFNESILVPNEYFDKATRNEMLALVYGDDTKGVVKDELVLKHQLHNVFSVSAAIENSITKKFPYCLQTHQSSLLVDINANEKDILYGHFYTDSFTVLLRKQGQLQVIQNFEFGTPEDALYHLLNVCQRFEVDAAATVLTACGMIEGGSNLYNELHKYFAAIQLYALPENFNYAAAIQEYPAHYFSHLFATASCVL